MGFTKYENSREVRFITQKIKANILKNFVIYYTETLSLQTENFNKLNF